MLALACKRCESVVDVVHLIYRSKHYESHSKDYEFSRMSMLEHWDSGSADMKKTLTDPRWLDRPASESGVHVFDLTTSHKVSPMPVALAKKRAVPGRPAPRVQASPFGK